MAEKPTYEELERRVQELKTDCSQLEKELQEARFFSEEIMRYMTEGLVLTDVRGTVIFINQRLSQMLGYPPEQIIGKCWLDMVPAEQHTIAQEAEARRFQGYTDRYEIILHHKDGHKFPVLIGAGPRFDKKTGEFIGTMGVVTDITERKQTLEELKESETRFKALHNASFGGIAIHHYGVILECNQGLSDMTGYEYSELIGMEGLLLIAEKSREEVMNHIRAGYEKPYEVFGLRKNGEEFPVRIEARNVPYKGKQVRTVEFRDITERKKAEKELHEAYDEIQDTNTALKVLLKKREKDQEEMEDKILANYQSLLEPLLYRLKKTAGRNQHNLLDILESNLSDMLSPFSQKLTDPLTQLTPKEVQVASFIKQDYSNKEIAETFNCSVRTIDSHRNSIRKKLDIKNKKVNLKTYLMTL